MSGYERGGIVPGPQPVILTADDFPLVRLRIRPVDYFRCPHDGCDFGAIEPCDPHTETIGDGSESVGRHCWDAHRCVDGHTEAWTHQEPGVRSGKPCVSRQAHPPPAAP